LPSPSGVTFPYATIARFESVITHASSDDRNPGDDHWSRMRSASDSDVQVSARSVETSISVTSSMSSDVGGRISKPSGIMLEAYGLRSRSRRR
jgi:hypothetical protein